MSLKSTSHTSIRLKEDDIDLLLPSFRPYVHELVRRLRAAGFDPLVRDTLRTFDEAERNALRGTGATKSMHCYGAAADLICGKHNWDCGKLGCRFFHVLGALAKDLRLTWGGDWKKRDMPHVQCVPATTLAQNKLRSLKTEKERDTYVRRFLHPIR